MTVVTTKLYFSPRVTRPDLALPRQYTPGRKSEVYFFTSWYPDTMGDRLTRSIWSVVCVMVLVDSCTGALLDRKRRQVEEQLGNVVRQFLEYEDQAQLDYVRYGLDLVGDGVGDLTDREDAQDRIFIGSVQVRNDGIHNF